MVATIGFFDGVHEGHKFLLRQLVSEAKRRGVKSVVITFKDHPRRVLQKDYIPELLTTNFEKERLLLQLGVDKVVFLEFTEDFRHLSAEKFMSSYLQKQLGITTLLVGYDHHFGCNQHESYEDYQRYGKAIGIEVILCEGHKIDSIKVSSTHIRRTLQQGNVYEANKCLGYEYLLSGTVVKGHQIGRTIGFPTANIAINNAYKLIPPSGVYAAWIEIDGQTHSCVLNIGNRPTVGNGNNITIEAHVFNYSDSLYDKLVVLKFVSRLREEMRFPSLEALQQQIKQDAEMARCILFDSRKL